jgi:hypothetical protein
MQRTLDPPSTAADSPCREPAAWDGAFYTVVP